jgi:MoaA/NifB/PqqE/SkfB family radical SAM enzyme
VISLYKRILKRITGQTPVTVAPENTMNGLVLSRLKDSLKKPFSFNIDIVDACNLQCVHCPRGVYYKKSTSTKMGLDVFNRLLEKITSEGKCEKVDLYNWSEPFLHPQLDKFVNAVKSKNIGCGLSSNLSFKNPSRLESVLMHAPALIVSVSGFTQAAQERYHKGSNLENVKSNLKFITNLKEKRHISPHVEIHCLQFIDNQEDQLLWKKFCDDNGFIYQSKPAYCSEVTTPETAARLLYKPGFYRDANGETKIHMNFSEAPSFEACPLHNTIPINAHGDVYLCCIYWNREAYKIGNYFETSLVSIQESRLLHRDCSHCTVFRKQ